ncbi:MAG TPA: hypothetical protein VK427_21800, partial [Kofleriaceae bacterium]|nr:hypothetical protein [Kofleriaceae bacterium]
MLRGRIATARPRWVLAAAWLWLVLYGFPGQMMPDTFEHLGEARSGVYTDGSPPVFTLLFAISDAISGGPLLLFLAQTTVFVAGAYMTLRRLVPRGAHWITLVLCAFPPVFTTLPIVWKDALMPGLLLCGAGCLLGGRRILALAALGLAISIRYNAFAAAFPLVVLLFEWRAGMHWLKRYAIAFAAWVGICTGAYTANDMLTDQPMHLWASSLALYDITGTLRFAPETLPDETLAPLLLETGLRFDKDIHAQLRARYRPGNFFNLVAGPNAAWDVPIYGYVPAPAKQRAAVSRAFSELVTTYPLAYLE